MKQPDNLPSSAAALAALISGSVLVLCLVLVCYGKRKLICQKCGKCCRRWRMSPDVVREYLTMEDLLLQVEDDDNADNNAVARLVSSSDNNNNNNNAAQEWTAELLVPNILKARVHKKRDSNNSRRSSNDLTTPLL